MNKIIKRREKLFIAMMVIAVAILFASCGENKQETSKNDSGTKDVSIVASGDMLYHDQVFYSAQKADGSYDFTSQFEMIKPLISKADLALGDFEGCIAPERELSGYPLFNAPPQVVDAIKSTGYDVIDLAHNHILDMNLKGAMETRKAFEEVGIDTIGLKDSADAPVLIKDVNGIKIAILGFCYGYNGMENTITDEEYHQHLDDLDMKNVEKRIKEAEEKADITVVMPQIGNEYWIEPTEEQKEIYRKMVDLGADIVFGGHPHVPEPTEVIKKDGENKFILYSMGNLISNQRIETMDGVMNNQWTERGVIMQVDIQKKNGKTTIKSITPHPTWVQKHPRGTYKGVYDLADYKVLLTEEYMPGGKYEGTLSKAETERVQKTYTEVMELMNIDKSLLKPAVKEANK